MLQEVTPDWNSTLNSKLNYPYKITKARKGTHGISIYSKHPLKLIKYIYNDNALPIAQIVELTIAGRKVLICNTHLASPAKAVENPDHFFELYFENYALRKYQYQILENYIKSVEKKYSEIIFAGDMNTTEYEPLFKDIKYHWKNSSTSCFTKSFPNSAKLIPLVNLDYILYRKNSQAFQYEVLKGGGSDHSAIYSEIVF